MSTGTSYTRNPPILGNETMWASFCLRKFRAQAIVRRHTHNRKTRNRSQIKHWKWSPKENRASLKMTRKDAQRDWKDSEWRTSENGAMEWRGPVLPNSLSKDIKAFFYKTGLLWPVHISEPEHKRQPQLSLGSISGHWGDTEMPQLHYFLMWQASNAAKHRARSWRELTFTAPKDLGSAHKSGEPLWLCVLFPILQEQFLVNLAGSSSLKWSCNNESTVSVFSRGRKWSSLCFSVIHFSTESKRCSKARSVLHSTHTSVTAPVSLLGGTCW